MIVVIKQGVYRHGIKGIFDDGEYALVEAAERARKAILAERDDYHTMKIISVPQEGEDDWKDEICLGIYKRKSFDRVNWTRVKRPKIALTYTGVNGEESTEEVEW